MNIRFSHGFTYLGLLFILTILGISLATAGVLWSFAQKREAERQLQFVGNQFRLAIKMYYEKSPGTLKRYPPNLKVLLEDDRYVTIQRYLRRIYEDPMTGNDDWGLVMAPEGGVMGVYSKSELNVLKTGNFSSVNRFLSDGRIYSDWKFVFLPTQRK